MTREHTDEVLELLEPVLHDDDVGNIVVVGVRPDSECRREDSVRVQPFDDAFSEVEGRVGPDDRRCEPLDVRSLAYGRSFKR